jgi:hypothetical protein
VTPSTGFSASEHLKIYEFDLLVKARGLDVMAEMSLEIPLSVRVPLSQPKSCSTIPNSMLIEAAFRFYVRDYSARLGLRPPRSEKDGVGSLGLRQVSWHWCPSHGSPLAGLCKGHHFRPPI